jgi:hypothetical protein
MSKENLLQALHNWIDQRPGLDPRNYNNPKDYQAEARAITADLHDAKALLRAIEWRAVSEKQILEASKRAFSGRLEIVAVTPLQPDTPTTYEIGYCTGQYWPTEYRKAVCAVLSQALWDYFRDSIANLPDPKGDALRRYIKKELGQRLQKRWFN